MSGIRAGSSGSGGWERSGNHGRSYVRSAALFCSLVRGFICGNMRITWWRGCGCFPGGQGVAGSNPAVPTGNRVFSNILTLRKSQQKSQLVVQWPFQRHAPIGCHSVLTRACANTAEPRSAQSRGSRSLRHPGSARRTHNLRTGRRHPRAHRLTASRSLTALQQLQDARQAWAPQPSLPTPWTRWPLA